MNGVHHDRPAAIQCLECAHDNRAHGGEGDGGLERQRWLLVMPPDRCRAELERTLEVLTRAGRHMDFTSPVAGHLDRLPR